MPRTSHQRQQLAFLFFAVVVLCALVFFAARALNDGFGNSEAVTHQARTQLETPLRLQKLMQMSIMRVHHFHIRGHHDEAAHFERERQAVDSLFAEAFSARNGPDVRDLEMARGHWNEAVENARKVLALVAPTSVPLDRIHADIQQIDMAVMMASDAIGRVHERDRGQISRRAEEAAHHNRSLVRMVLGAFTLTLLAVSAAGITVYRSQVVFRELSARDGLTGLLNRREFHRQLQRQLAQNSRPGHACSLILLDIDHFKSVNDTYGHQFGDTVLQLISQCITREVRGGDLVARFGGEEIVVILPGATSNEAGVIAGRIHRAIASAACTAPDGSCVRLTVSIGIASFPEDAHTEDSLIRAADQAMYDAKSRGRNQVRRHAEWATFLHPSSGALSGPLPET
ncbi:GGDEF domain-containing protein [Deinococcus peraridilitoris]|uniref:GGDEF domain-containing protein n=1 Tax=Deinococcus peraridilitoris TaxID=432329 RepID=UPI0012F91223|nr:GGDEF domain-containing protein [Deinococcus peraridilitoris]